MAIPCSAVLARLASGVPLLTTATVRTGACSRCHRPRSGNSALHGPQVGFVKTSSTGFIAARRASSVCVSPWRPTRRKAGAGAPIGNPGSSGAAGSSAVAVAPNLTPRASSRASNSSRRTSSRPFCPSRWTSVQPMAASAAVPSSATARPNAATPDRSSAQATAKTAASKRRATRSATSMGDPLRIAAGCVTARSDDGVNHRGGAP